MQLGVARKKRGNWGGGGGGGGGSDPLRRAVGKREWIIERQISRAFWLSAVGGAMRKERILDYT